MHGKTELYHTTPPLYLVSNKNHWSIFKLLLISEVYELNLGGMVDLWEFLCL